MLIDPLWRYIGCSIKPDELFTTSAGLQEKVDSQGHLKPYYGNTAVFLLDETTKWELLKIQEELYQKSGDILADKLSPATFHMTLHDLANGPILDGSLQSQMKEMEAKARLALTRWSDQRPIRMKATWMFNMVNTSIVLGLEPTDEDESYWRLGQLYWQFQGIKPLGYAMTPHITLAYFKPGVYGKKDEEDWKGEEQLRRLAKAMRPVNLSVSLQMKDLVLQEFTDMNHYRTI